MTPRQCCRARFHAPKQNSCEANETKRNETKRTAAERALRPSSTPLTDQIPDVLHPCRMSSLLGSRRTFSLISSSQAKKRDRDSNSDRITAARSELQYYRVAHFKSPKAFRPLSTYSPTTTPITPGSASPPKTVLLLHHQRCRKTSQDATRACRNAVTPSHGFPARIAV